MKVMRQQTTGFMLLVKKLCGCGTTLVAYNISIWMPITDMVLVLDLEETQGVTAGRRVASGW